ncbi:MAG: RsiV family protein [Eubacteriales bacterium]|nr:RsiV family protein [Eubacteriales bacterium]
MNNHKKYYSLFLCLIIIFLLSACQNKVSNVASSSNTTLSTEDNNSMSISVESIVNSETNIESSISETLSIESESSESDNVSDITIIEVAKEVSIENSYMILKAKMPQIKSNLNQELYDAINYEIKQKFEQDLESAKKDAMEEYDAFNATNETVALENLPASYSPMLVDIYYTIKCNDSNYFSMEFTTTTTRANASYSTIFFNVDKKQNKRITLNDIFGDNFLTIITDKVNDQIEELKKTNDWAYIEGTDPKLFIKNTFFYINENHQSVVVFDKYTLAVGAAGVLQFIIEK